MSNKYHVSLSDTDLYKLTMQLAICRLYPKVRARYEFINRDKRAFPDGFKKRLREIILSFQDYTLTANEIAFMKDKCYYMDPVYLDFLKGYRYNPAEVRIEQMGETLKIFIEGHWYSTVLWEVPLMATISELYFEMTGQKGAEHSKRRLDNALKAKELAKIGVLYSDFGTRRRFSFENHDMVIEDLKINGSGHLLGTSNVYLAMKHNLTPMGTVAHEWFQGHAAMFGFIQANKEALEAWVNVYNGDLGIALPDTFTTDAFYKYAFDNKYAKLFDGVRQDSGNPLEFLNKTINHYNSLRIQPKLKTVLFSDNLKSLDQIKEIHAACKDQIQDRYGIGTWFSNSVSVQPLNMVIKLTGLDFGYGWVNTVKISDSPTKHTGNMATIDLCLKTLNI